MFSKSGVLSSPTANNLTDAVAAHVPGQDARTLRIYLLPFCPVPVAQTTKARKLLRVSELAAGLFNPGIA